MTFALKMPKLALVGVGAIEESIENLIGAGYSKPLLVTDETIVKLGLTDKVTQTLSKHNVESVLFGHVTPNPTAELVREGKQAYLDNDCDCFIAVGGGSPIDCAKAIRVMVSNDGDICDYNGINKVKNSGDFFIAINTTAGTSAEMTSNSVITDTVTSTKMVIIDDKQIPDIAVNDPTIMIGLPSHVTASTGMDALTHAIEAFVTPGNHTLTEPTAAEAIKLISQWLPVAVEDGENIEAREKLACGQYLAGMAFNSAGLGLVHAMAHQPGATHDLPHGVCNAILLPHVCEFNAQQVPERYKRIAEVMSGKTLDLDDESGAQLAVKLIQELSDKVKIPSGFEALGIKEADIDMWIDKALADPCLGGNPRVPTADEIKNLYVEAL
ncbi:alcohol dehydrogenase [Vibrio sp. qd031]|uniref:iron-containing alcohol dehydrogenase n=1 Tax=Vibrio sp. qd031 TaxID=1603038 RepID=UPI000A11C7F1|nr:iron-containing alcohol dehydrogenase [Vibrio sp. qd031]ORT52274.1 alcohol dehydrogenase [Vibrio sp. qd031]